MYEPLTAGLFAPHVGDAFVLRAADGQIDATLSEVTPADAPAHDGRVPFSLVWEGPLAPGLQQGMHAVEHPSVGTIEMFLVPIEPTPTARRYEAVFS